MTLDRTAEQLKREAAARSGAARSLFTRASLAVEVVDEHCWKVAGRLFWPSTGFWRRADGSPGGGGASTLIAEIRADRPEPPAAA